LKIAHIKATNVCPPVDCALRGRKWIPAFAGMTDVKKDAIAGFRCLGQEVHAKVMASAQSWTYCFGSKFVSMVQVTALPHFRR
jgi:hypothetical protein